jgi:hypothetical protein
MFIAAMQCNVRKMCMRRVFTVGVTGKRCSLGEYAREKLETHGKGERCGMKLEERIQKIRK